MKAEALFKVKIAEFEKMPKNQLYERDSAIIFAACIIAEAIRNSAMDESQ